MAVPTNMNPKIKGHGRSNSPSAKAMIAELHSPDGYDEEDAEYANERWVGLFSPADMAAPDLLAVVKFAMPDVGAQPI